MLSLLFNMFNLMAVSNALHIIDKIDTLTYPVVPIIESDVVIFSSTYRTHPVIYTCPEQEPCHILCMASPKPLAGRGTGRGTMSSCGNLIIVAGYIDKLKIVCEDNACIGMQVQSSAQENVVECQKHAACAGSKMQCGYQSPNKYLHMAVLPKAHIKSCEFVCTDGGCAGYGSLKGAHIRCVGNVGQCLVKANSAVPGFNYFGPAKDHVGSFTGATMDCRLDGPLAGACVLECSDFKGTHYCNKAKYICKTDKAKCMCMDYCAGGRFCDKKSKNHQGDCPKIK